MPEANGAGRIWIPLICVVMGALLSAIATMALTKNGTTDNFVTKDRYTDFIKTNDEVKAAVEKEIAENRAALARLEGKLDEALSMNARRK